MFTCVVLTYNRLHSLQRCLYALINRSTYDNRIIVVDNGSTDGTQEFVRQLSDLDVELIQSTNDMGVISRNLAFKQADTEYIAQIDDDVVVNPEWDIFPAEYLTTGQCEAVGVQGSYVCSDWSNMNDGPTPLYNYCDCLAGYCWAFKNEGWLYDENLAPFWFEEGELQLRMTIEKRYRKLPINMYCTHLCQRNTPVNWEIHNKNMAYVRNKYQGIFVSERERKNEQK